MKRKLKRNFWILGFVMGLCIGSPLINLVFASLSNKVNVETDITLSLAGSEYQTALLDDKPDYLKYKDKFYISTNIVKSIYKSNVTTDKENNTIDIELADNKEKKVNLKSKPLKATPKTVSENRETKKANDDSNDKISKTDNDKASEKKVEQNNTAPTDATDPKDSFNTAENKLNNNQSDLMLEYTGKAWSPALQNEMNKIDFNSLGFDVQNPKLITDINSPFVLANKANFFPKKFAPINLVKPKSKHAGSPDRRKMRKIAADAIDKLTAAAQKDKIDIQTVSAYRSIAYQKALFKRYCKKEGIEKANKYSSRPQFSEHHTGLCVDVSSPCMKFGLDRSYGKTKEGKWLSDNAHKYGFVIRYPEGKKKYTGYVYEPWHIRYLGVELASYLKETNLCYEEFLALQLGINPKDIEIKE